jgi:hypothetical protein
MAIPRRGREAIAASPHHEPSFRRLGWHQVLAMTTETTALDRLLWDKIRSVWADFRMGAQTTGRHLAMEKSLTHALEGLHPIREILSVEVVPTASETDPGPSVLVKIDYLANDDGVPRTIQVHLDDA